MAENKAMSKELEEIKAKVAASKVDSLFDNAEEADGVKWVKSKWVISAS